MSLPNSADLNSLDYAYLGAPFVDVEAKGLGTTSLDYAYLGSPFVGAPAGAVSLNVWVKVSGDWKPATAMFVRDGGVWKSVSDVSVKASGTWKT